MHTCICIYIYMQTERERERESLTGGNTLATPQNEVAEDTVADRGGVGLRAGGLDPKPPASKQASKRESHVVSVCSCI